MLIKRQSLTGIDNIIDLFATKMYKVLVTDKPSALINVYPRIYINESTDKKNEAEHSYNKKDYTRLLFDDRIDLQSFFICGDEIINEGLVNRDVSLVVSANLNTLFSDKNERQDEFLNALIKKATSHTKSYFKLKKVNFELKDVYREFDKDYLQNSNIQPRCILRFDFDVKYSACFCC